MKPVYASLKIDINEILWAVVHKKYITSITKDRKCWIILHNVLSLFVSIDEVSIFILCQRGIHLFTKNITFSKQLKLELALPSTLTRIPLYSNRAVRCVNMRKFILIIFKRFRVIFFITHLNGIMCLLPMQDKCRLHLLEQGKCSKSAQYRTGSHCTDAKWSNTFHM